MLRAYMDDSGTHNDSPYCLIAGYWGGINQWRQFEHERQRVLRAYNVPEFHAWEYWARDKNKERVGPYKGWDDTRRKTFLFALLTIIGKYKIYPFAHGVSRSEWNKRSTEERKLLCGGERGNLTAPNNPMFMAFQTCVIRTSAYCDPDVAMHFVLDSNQNTDAWASICYVELKRLLARAGDPMADRLGDLTFSESIRALPLQAADLLAYEAFKYAIWAKGDRKAKVRPAYMMALQNFRSEQDFWLYDAERFANIKRLANAITDRGA